MVEWKCAFSQKLKGLPACIFQKKHLFKKDLFSIIRVAIQYLLKSKRLIFFWMTYPLPSFAFSNHKRTIKEILNKLVKKETSSSLKKENLQQTILSMICGFVGFLYGICAISDMFLKK